MTRAIEHIVTSYSTLKDRKALEEIRDHRRRLLNEHRMRSSSVLNFESIKDELQEEIRSLRRRYQVFRIKTRSAWLNFPISGIVVR